MDHSKMNHSMMGHAMSTVASMMDHMANGTHHNHDHHGMGHGATTPPVDHSMHNHVDHSMHNHVDHSMLNHVDHSMHNHEQNGTGAGDVNHQHHEMGSHMDMPGMKMYFHDGVKEYVLFKECETNSTETLIAACFAVFAVAVLYEGLKYFREALLQRSLVERQSGARYLDGKPSPGSSHEQMVVQVGNTSVLNRMLSGGHFVQTILHMVQVFVSYCLMLVFMTYNVWLCLAVIVGAGVGYFLFGWKRAVVVDTNEHCH